MKIRGNNNSIIPVLAIASVPVAIFSAIFIFPLPASPTFFDGIGRIILSYIIGAICLWFLLDRDERKFSEIIVGSVMVVFIGSLVGLVFIGILQWLR
jgi:hypothetical protein